MPFKRIDNLRVKYTDDGTGAVISVDTDAASDIEPSNAVYQLLTTTGVVDGSIEMNVNGSVTPVNFDYIVPEGRSVDVARINIRIGDGKVVPSKFGDIAELANGLLVQILDTDGSTVLQNFSTDQAAIKKTADFSSLAANDVDISDGTGTQYVYIRWTLERIGRPILMTAGQRFRIIVRDDLTGLIEFRAELQGIFVA